MTTTEQRLTNAECKAIAEMIDSQPFVDLCRVVMAKRDKAQIAFLNDKINASEEKPNYNISAEGHAKCAKDYHTFLQIVQELRHIAVTDKQFCIVEIKPTS